MVLARQYPDSFPPVHPVPEYRADGTLKQSYDEVKRVLQVPWMGVVTMAFAHYPTFFATLWDGVKPLCASAPFVAAMADLRAFAEAGAATLDPPPIAARLRATGYAERELDDIRAVIEVFSHGNQPYATIATIARLLLEGGTLRAGREAAPFEGRHGPSAAVPFVLMEPHHADPPTRALYEDIKATLRLPIVNTDYRALARWPSYAALAWNDLKPVIATPAYETVCGAIHDRIAGLAVHTLPNPGALDGAALRAAAERDASLEEVRGVVRLFQWLLPGLIANVAFFRAQLL